MDRSTKRKKDQHDFSSWGKSKVEIHHQTCRTAALSGEFRILLIQRRIRLWISEAYGLDVAISPQNDAENPRDDDILPRLDAKTPRPDDICPCEIIRPNARARHTNPDVLSAGDEMCLNRSGGSGSGPGGWSWHELGSEHAMHDGRSVASGVPTSGGGAPALVGAMMGVFSSPTKKVLRKFFVWPRSGQSHSHRRTGRPPRHGPKDGPSP